METEKMGIIYQKIAEQINEIIPSEWEKVALYAEILDDSSEVYFFFTTPQNQEYIYSHDIPEHFNVDEDIYDDFYMNCMITLKSYGMNLKQTTRTYGQTSLYISNEAVNSQLTTITPMSSPQT